MQDEEYYKIFQTKIENTNTSTNYSQRLNGLVRKITEHYETLQNKKSQPKKLITHIITHPSYYIPIIEQRYDNNELTIKNIVTMILALFKYGELKCKYEAHYKRWKKVHEKYYEKENTRYESNLPTKVQKDKYISFEDLQKVYGEIKDVHKDFKSSIRYCLFSMYMHIRPKRSDFGNIKVYRSKDPGKKDINYIFLHQKNWQKSCFVFNHINKVVIKEPIIEPIHQELYQIFQESLKKYPRDYLFVGHDLKPFSTANAYGKFVSRTFETYTGKKIGTSMIRHMFINEKINLNEMSIQEKNEYAHAMGHDRQQQEKYKLFFDKEA